MLIQPARVGPPAARRGAGGRRWRACAAPPGHARMVHGNRRGKAAHGLTRGDVTPRCTATRTQAIELAEPPIPGGRVEALTGVFMRQLKSSLLARPLPAVSMSVLGLGLLAFIGLCATSPGASGATLPVYL